MSFIQREIDLLNSALRGNLNESDRAATYAAQQALSWVTDPGGFKSPIALLRGTQEETKDCLAYPRPDVS